MGQTRWVLALLLGFAFVAGCAADNGTSDTTSGTPSGGDASPGSGDEASATWGAYRFDERVEPRSGGGGKIQSYAYTHTAEDAGEVTAIHVEVEVLGISTETVRGQAFDFSSGATEPTPVTAPVEVAKLRHTLSVEQDDTGELSAGDSAVVTLWMPTDGATMTALWQFVHVDFEEDGATGVWESLPMEEGQTTMTLPYTEGEDPTGWWGFEHLLTTYAFSWWAGLFQEGDIEEGSHDFGGFRYSAERETLDVSGYAFDGWRVAWSAATADDSGGYTIAVAPGLPLPFEHAFTSTTGGETNRYEYKLTALDLG